jgi:hypothetical protein
MMNVNKESHSNLIEKHLAVGCGLKNLQQSSRTRFLAFVEVRNHISVRGLTAWSNLSVKHHKLMNRHKPAWIAVEDLVNMPLENATLAVPLQLQI